MTSWFRSWHGAPTDNKWLLIAKKVNANATERNRTQVNAGMVSATLWALFDHASQQENRGCVKSFDAETYSVFSGFSVEEIALIIEALKDKKIIENDRLTSWDKRQPIREDGAAERAKKWREKQKTERNRTQPNDTEENRTEQRREDLPPYPPQKTYPQRRKKNDKAKLALEAAARGLAEYEAAHAEGKPRSA